MIAKKLVYFLLKFIKYIITKNVVNHNVNSLRKKMKLKQKNSIKS